MQTLRVGYFTFFKVSLRVGKNTFVSLRVIFYYNLVSQASFFAEIPKRVSFRRGLGSGPFVFAHLRTLLALWVGAVVLLNLITTLFSTVKKTWDSENLNSLIFSSQFHTSFCYEMYIIISYDLYFVSITYLERFTMILLK